VVEFKNTCNFVVGMSEGNRLVGRPRHRWEDIIKIYLSVMWWELLE
jgi:hypothetical protein